jgi:hypothetical protein
MNRNGAPPHGDILGLELVEVHSADHFAVDEQEQSVTHEELGQVRAVALTGDNLIHRVTNRFEPLQLLNLPDDRGLTRLNDRTAAPQTRDQPYKPCSGNEPDQKSYGCK